MNEWPVPPTLDGIETCWYNSGPGVQLHGRGQSRDSVELAAVSCY